MEPKKETRGRKKGVKMIFDIDDPSRAAGEPPAWTCENCGKLFRRWKSWFRGTVIGCSHRCTRTLKAKKESA